MVNSSYANSFRSTPGAAGPARTSSWHRLSAEQMAADGNRLKSEVDLFCVAELLGFDEADEAGKMTHSGIGTIAIGVARDTGHWVWIDYKAGIGGSAADLIGLVYDCGFGTAMKKLRRMAADLGAAGTSREKPLREASDRPEIEWHDLSWVVDFNLFLNVTRGLDAQVTAAPRFSGTWRTDQHKNAVFPYVAEARHGDEIVGVERRNRAPAQGMASFRRYSTGGSPGIWTSRKEVDDIALAIVESPIDAMSFYQLAGVSRQRMRFAAIRAGSPEASIRRAIAEMRAGTPVIAACDADPAGDAYNAIIARCAAAEGHPCRVMTPAGGAKDWNAMLLNKQRPAP